MHHHRIHALAPLLGLRANLFSGQKLHYTLLRLHRREQVPIFRVLARAHQVAQGRIAMTETSLMDSPALPSKSQPVSAPVCCNGLCWSSIEYYFPTGIASTGIMVRRVHLAFRTVNKGNTALCAILAVQEDLQRPNTTSEPNRICGMSRQAGFQTTPFANSDVAQRRAYAENQASFSAEVVGCIAFPIHPDLLQLLPDTHDPWRISSTLEKMKVSETRHGGSFALPERLAEMERRTSQPLHIAAGTMQVHATRSISDIICRRTHLSILNLINRLLLHLFALLPVHLPVNSSISLLALLFLTRRGAASLLSRTLIIVLLRLSLRALLRGRRLRGTIPTTGICAIGIAVAVLADPSIRNQLGPDGTPGVAGRAGVGHATLRGKHLVVEL
ncbi:hypothetical protein KC363_g49 [Hortaea werneckii]|nr:hypothetical protein KC363_g49 [Hortaea werneckii]